MENVQEPAEGRPPEVTRIPISQGTPEADEIAELLTKRAHCPHSFRYAIIAEHKKTREETLYAWCEHCGLANRTEFVDDFEPESS